MVKISHDIIDNFRQNTVAENRKSSILRKVLIADPFQVTNSNGTT